MTHEIDAGPLRKKRWRFFYCCAAYLFIIPFFLLGCSTKLSDKIKEYGYSELRPPSNLIRPGAVVAFKNGSTTVITNVCTQEAALGPNFRVHTSDTVSTGLSESFSGSFNVNLSSLQGNDNATDISLIKNVKINISNPKIQEVSGDAIASSSHSPSSGCVSAMKGYSSCGIQLTMIESVLIADVDYEFTWNTKASLTTATKNEIINKVVPLLGGGLASEGQEKVKGKQLVFGIRDNQLFASFLVQNDLNHRLSKRDTVSYLISPYVLRNMLGGPLIDRNGLWDFSMFRRIPKSNAVIVK